MTLPGSLIRAAAEGYADGVRLQVMPRYTSSLSSPCAGHDAWVEMKRDCHQPVCARSKTAAAWRPPAETRDCVTVIS